MSQVGQDIPLSHDDVGSCFNVRMRDACLAVLGKPIEFLSY